MIKNCFIWTRVSTKHQEENGGSLDDQKCRCEKYAKDNGYTIKGYFGGTHESAKTPGKLIREMIAAVKKDKTVKYVIVNQADRFSRNAGQAINIINDLKSQGITIVEASTGLDTASLEGNMMIQFKLSLAEWDNANRTNKFTSGRKHCMESGVWIGKRPIGYTKSGKSINTEYTINDTGKLICKAFKWKLQGVDNFRIMDRLSAMGLNVSKQKLHKILTNPFYAGKIQSKFTNNEIIDGNHPAIVSWSDFLKVQEILSGRTGVYKHKKETPQFPLKRHIRCAADGTMMTSYTQKKIDYYKCNKKGCCNNVSAKKVHRLYEELLNRYSIPETLKKIFCQVIGDILNKSDVERKEVLAALKKQNTELKNKIKSCKVKYGCDEMEEDVYTVTIEALQDKLAKNELELSKVKENLSNQDTTVQDIASTFCRLGCLWHNSELELCQKIQNLLFPNGILWDKEIGNYRTIDENKALAIILRLSDSCKNKKEENPFGNSSSVTLCGQRDSNPHASRHQILSLTWLPITPCPQDLASRNT